jgi:hypothetical protein
VKTFIANFGHANYLWPLCLDRSSVATFEDEDLRPLWLAGDREGFIQRCITTRTTARGIAPTRPVASRWFNLAGIVSETENDLWIHREKNELWWTVTRPGQVRVEVQPSRPGSVVQNIYVLHKAAEKWSNKNKRGLRLEWPLLHPKAREFLFTEGTLQQLSDDNAAYARALVEGADLTPWHSRPAWKKKADAAGRGAATVFDGPRRAALRMVKMAIGTAASSNGQQVVRTVKNKDVRFGSEREFERYVEALIEAQEGLCAITDLRLQYDGDFEDAELLCSLDRIDSNGHYEAGNLQVVCRFVNRWKSDGDDRKFRRLVALVQGRAESSSGTFLRTDSLLPAGGVGEPAGATAVRGPAERPGPPRDADGGEDPAQ